MRFPVPILAFLTAGVLLGAGGCATPQVARYIAAPPVPSFHNDAGCAPMRRVAVLPIDFEEQAATSPNGLDSVFCTELSKTSAFEVVPISRQELSEHFGIGPLSSVRVIPGDLLTRLNREYAVDGVLFTDVTHYFPYRPIAIGIRCKLVDTRTGTERWVFDHTFDSGSPQVAGAAKQFGEREQSAQLPILTEWDGILDSPTQFGKYVAHETYRSLMGI